MYSLRVITGVQSSKGSGIEVNTYIGRSYRLIRKSERSDFNELIESKDSLSPEEKEKVFAILYSDSSDGNLLIPLLDCDENFIVTERGKTYSKIKSN